MSDKSRLKILFENHRTEYTLGVVIVAVSLIITLIEPAFATFLNLTDLLEAQSVMMIFALGVFVVLITGGIDISFPATASIAQYLTAWVALKHGFSMPVCLLISLASGIALGLINALLIHYLRAVSIIVTIATLSAYFSLLMYFTNGRSIYRMPDWWTENRVFFETEAATGELIRITLPIVLMILLALFTWTMMEKTRLGRQLYALGGDREAARRIGINVTRLHLFAYAYLGLFSGIAGLVQAHRVQEAVPFALAGTELNVLAAVVLGGASLSGGKGTVAGVCLGVLLLAVIQNGLNLLGISPYAFEIVTGIAILVSICASGLRKNNVA